MHAPCSPRLRVAAIAIGAAVLTCSCTSLSTEGRKVRVTANPDVVRGCTFVGNVSGSSGWGNAAAAAGEESVQNQMQNETARLGGNVLFLVSSRAGFTARGVGEAYACPPTTAEKPGTD